jgi:DNA-binding beta-propeller fold protein YncE
LVKVPIGIRPNGLAYDSRNRLLLAANVGDPSVVGSLTLSMVDVMVDVAGSGKIVKQVKLSGSPDVIFFNRALKHLYVAIGDPGVIDVFDTEGMIRLETVSTEFGAQTIGFDPEQNKVYAFLPEMRCVRCGLGMRWASESSGVTTTNVQRNRGRAGALARVGALHVGECVRLGL